MAHSGNWSPYTGNSSIILAVVLFIITGVLLYVATRLHRPIEVKRPGKALGAIIFLMLLLSIMAFLIATAVYVLALSKQVGKIPAVPNPITPVTMSSAVLTFFIILYLAQNSGLRIAVGSAIVGTIAAPMIFELPFDLIVMWHTYPPTPQTLFTLLYFLPLFLIEISSFAMLMLSPLVKFSRYTLFILAGLFFVFAVWALFGFGYPLTPLPTAFNMLSKVIAFAAAVSLFLPRKKIATSVVQERERDSTKSHDISLPEQSIL